MMLWFRAIGLIALGTILATTSPGSADPGRGNSSNSGGKGNSGAGGGAAGNGGGNSSQGNSAGAKSQGNQKTRDFTALDDTASLRAVEIGQAVPLDVILAVGRARLRSKIIDVRLLRLADETLVYEIKGLDRHGVVKNAYFYASSGKPVTN